GRQVAGRTELCVGGAKYRTRCGCCGDGNALSYRGLLRRRSSLSARNLSGDGGDAGLRNGGSDMKKIMVAASLVVLLGGTAIAQSGAKGSSTSGGATSGTVP